MRTFTMKYPEQGTKDRIKEVQFYLIFKQLKKEKKHNPYLTSVIEYLALLNNCKITNIEYAENNLEHMLSKPTPLELGLAHKYLDIPIRHVCSLAKVASKTIYDALEKYVKEGSPELQPKFALNILEDIEKFNKGIGETFKLISFLTRDGVVYDRS